MPGVSSQLFNQIATPEWPVFGEIGQICQHLKSKRKANAKTLEDVNWSINHVVLWRPSQMSSDRFEHYQGKLTKMRPRGCQAFMPTCLVKKSVSVITNIFPLLEKWNGVGKPYPTYDDCLEWGHGRGGRSTLLKKLRRRGNADSLRRRQSIVKASKGESDYGPFDRRC